MNRDWIRDWWRGFANEDINTSLMKTESARDVAWLTRAEMKAWRAFTGGGGVIAFLERRLGVAGRRQGGMHDSRREQDNVGP